MTKKKKKPSQPQCDCEGWFDHFHNNLQEVTDFLVEEQEFFENELVVIKDVLELQAKLINMLITEINHLKIEAKDKFFIQ